MSQPSPNNLFRRPAELGTRVLSALAYPHPVGSFVEAVDARLRLRTSSGHTPARVVAVDRPTADTARLTLRPAVRWTDFQPGQFVQLAVEVDGVRRVRCFSPAQSSHLDDGLVELAIKVNGEGRVSRHLYDHAVPGMRLALSAPQGEFHLPAVRPGRILLISGGSGITPVLSMLRTLVDEGHTGRVTFLHYLRRPQDQIAADELAAIDHAHANIDVITVFTDPAFADAGAAAGHCTTEQLASLVPDFDRAETWLCGPEGLMQAVESVYALRECSQRLHTERFSLATPVTPDPGPSTGELRFARSERVIDNSGATLLEQAEAAGLRPQHGCRMGICSTCTCRKQSGAVRNLQTGAISTESDEDIRICISQPVGSVTLDL
ncbi:MAG: ferredoxin reductase [Pseudomonadota bacterium]|nr:ferredoxin reductase [Pseudomonadota bacterium]